METFKPKICKMCGREFIPTSNSQKYCGSQKLKTGCSYKVWVMYAYAHKKEIKEKTRIRNQKPEVKERARIRSRLYYQLPENKEKARMRYQKPENKEKIRIRKKSPEYRLRDYKKGAKRRGLGWEIDNEFYELLKQPCFYCGVTSEIGVDRIDNSKGYTKENCVSCCSLCNFMKSKYAEKEFINHCKKIAEFNKLKVEINKN